MRLSGCGSGEKIMVKDDGKMPSGQMRRTGATVRYAMVGVMLLCLGCATVPPGEGGSSAAAEWDTDHLPAALTNSIGGTPYDRS